MALDPNIILQAKPVQFDNPLNALAQYSQIQNAQNQNALSQYTIGKAKRDDERSTAVQNALVSTGGDAQAGYQALAKQGYLKEALDLQKSQLDQDKTRSEVDKNRASTATSNYDLQLKKTETIGQTLGALLKTPDVGPQQISQSLQQLAGSGIITPEQAQQAIQGIPQDAAQIPAYLQQHQMAAMKTADQLKYTMPDANAQLNAQTSRQNNAATNATSLATNANTVNNAAQTAGMVDRRAAATAQAKTAPKPLPTAALKMQQDSLDAIGTASGINSDLSSVGKQITDGKLDFGLFSNAKNSTLNTLGLSTEGSRNFQSFKSTLEKLRNDSLRLNKGVQTDGDAQRAWNELFTNINDKQVVQQRLDEIQRINERGATLHQLNVDNIRNNYGAEPLDTSGYKSQPATVGANVVQRPANPQAAVKAAVDSGQVRQLAASRPVSVNNPQEYARLPSGTLYMAPDGSMRTKP